VYWFSVKWRRSVFELASKNPIIKNKKIKLTINYSNCIRQEFLCRSFALVRLFQISPRRQGFASPRLWRALDSFGLI